MRNTHKSTELTQAAGDLPIHVAQRDFRGVSLAEAQAKADLDKTELQRQLSDAQDRISEGQTRLGEAQQEKERLEYDLHFVCKS